MNCNLCGAAVAANQQPRWVKDGFSIYQCRSCGLLFRGDLPNVEEVLAIYGREYFRRDEGVEADGYADYLGDAEEHRMTAKRRVRRLRKTSDRGRLLDVGAAAGFFMAEAQAEGWETQGIDVSPDMSGWGRKELGLDITTGLFQLADYDPRSFDAVTMWDYIEHSIDPAADFAKAAAVLKPGGVLMLTTGDAAALFARISGRRWHLLTPRHHNFFFTVATLRRYLNDNGFDVVEVGHPGAQYSLHYLVYKLGTMAPRSRLISSASNWFDERSLGERSLRFNLFDIVTITARRR
jgi:SAM-dependent methyltransferase